VPILSMFIGFIFKTHIENMGFYLITATNLIPLVSPLSTIVLFRRRVVTMIIKPFGSKNKVGMIVTASRSDNSTHPRKNTLNVL
jgi:hypothetical protein